MKAGIGAVAAAVVLLAALAGASQASKQTALSLSPQTVLAWNANAWTVVSQAQHPREVTPPATRSLFQAEGLLYVSYAQAAVYNAVVAIEGRYEPYGISLSAPDGASADAAVAQAAHDVLKHYLGAMLTPAQVTTLDGWLASSLAAIPNGQSKTDGISVGLAAALGIEALRANDGRDGPEGNYGTGPIEAGAWVLTPGPFNFAQTPWLGEMRPFVLKSPDQFKSQPPPELRSEKWARDFNETKAYGSATSTVRTNEQKATGYFWNANAVNQLNTELRESATQNGMDLVDTARLLAAGVIAVEDASMACWHSKYTYLFWRPLTAIRNADIDGNPKTEAETAWAPLVTHPNHPEWPSAHGCVSGSATQALSELLGTNRIDVTVRGAENGATTLTTSRHFDTVDEYRSQVENARVWAGFHYRSAVKAGLKLGEKVAHWDLAHAFRPVTNEDED